LHGLRLLGVAVPLIGIATPIILGIALPMIFCVSMLIGLPV
jgi:hypothetical protein